MHAYLGVGTDKEELKIKSEELAKKLKAKIFKFPLAKIGDVRDLNNLIRLSFSEPTLIVCENVEETTDEALNAFLKNLEEPQENIYFFLTTSSLAKVLPTIVSRCQVIKSTNKQIYKSTNYEEMEKFTTASTGQKLAFLDKIKGREEALSFLENLTVYYHQKLHEKDVDFGEIARTLGNIDTALNNIKANGNVALHMANMAVNEV